MISRNKLPKLEKKIEKLNYQLHSGQVLSEAQRKQNEDKVKKLRGELEGLEAKSTKPKVTKISFKYH